MGLLLLRWVEITYGRLGGGEVGKVGRWVSDWRFGDVGRYINGIHVPRRYVCLPRLKNVPENMPTYVFIHD